MLIIIFALVGISILISFAFAVSIYNNLVKRRNKVKNSWAHIDAQLQRKFDLVPNLVETIKAFTEHEQQLLENVTSVRGEYINAHSNKEKLYMDAKLNTCLRSLYVMAEENPTLKSNVQFLQLQEALTEIEEDITYARQFYNDAVTIYNNQLMAFPNNIIASMFGFEEETLFDAFKSDESTLRIHFKTKCPVCGAAIVENSSKCQYCGTSL